MPGELPRACRRHDELGCRIREEGVSRKQVGLIIESEPLKGPNTTFWPISKDRNTVGKVTSAVYSPRLEQNIALAMVTTEFAELGTQVEVMMPGGIQMATVVERPFYDPKKQITTA